VRALLRARARPRGPLPARARGRRSGGRAAETERERGLERLLRAARVVEPAPAHRRQQMNLDRARPGRERALEIVERLAHAAFALADPRAVVEQVGERGIDLERAGHLELCARVLAGVEEREPEMGARLRRVATRQAGVGVVGIPELRERALEALRRALEVAAVEMRDAPLVIPVPPPAQPRTEELQAPPFRPAAFACAAPARAIDAARSARLR